MILLISLKSQDLDGKLKNVILNKNKLNKLQKTLKEYQQKRFDKQIRYS